MGNCVALSKPNKRVSWHHSSDRKVLRVVKSDGKVLEYHAPVLVRDLLSNFHGFGVAASREACHCLAPDHELRIGRAYYLLPLGVSLFQPQDVCHPAKDTEKQGDGGKRIKVVLTKHQLRELLSKRMSFEEVLSGLQATEKHSTSCATSWKPKLETIPEGSEIVP